MITTQKVKYYYEISEQTAQKAVSNRAEWMKLLDTSAKMYKYSFLEQLLIHNQKPDSIACAQIEVWNNSFDRWVNRGIAIIYETNTKPRLRYVFDVSDTHVYRENTPTVNLWELKEEHIPLVLAKLANIYDDIETDISENDSISDIFHNIANQMAAEYYDDNSQEIRYRVENSFIEGLYDDNLRVAFTDCASTSIAYVLMARCGYDVSEYFTEEDFGHITSFNTSDMIHLLDETTRDLSSQVLRDVELVVKKYERQKLNKLTKNIKEERNVENEAKNQPNTGGTEIRSAARPEQTADISGADGDRVRDGGGLSSSEHSTGGRGRTTSWQVRNDEEELSSGTPQNNPQYASEPGETVPTLQGDRGISGSEINASDDDVNRQSESARQGNRPDGMDSGNEHVETSSGGTGSSRTDLRLHLVNTQSEPPQPTETLSKALSASSITIDEADSILRDGGNSRNSILRITAQLAKNLPHEANADYLQEEYLKGRYKHHSGSEGGKGFQFGTKEVSVWFDKDVITIGRGKSAQNATSFIQLSWEQVAERIKQLYDAGHFINHDVLEEALHNEYVEMAESLLDLYRDDFRDFRKVPESWMWNKGWPVAVEQNTGLLKNKGEYQTILDNLTADISAMEANPELRTRHYHDAKRTLSDLEKLGIEPKGFLVSEIHNINAMRFITNDEADSHLIKGSNFSEAKMRILSHFLHNHTPKENIDFLKNEYGQGGGSWGNIWRGWYEHSPSKGITLKRTGCEDVNINWSNVSKRIAELIKSGRYMTQAELDRIPQYEKIMLARQVNSFFRDLPVDEQYRSPFPKDFDFYYPKHEEFEALSVFTKNKPTADGIRPIDDCIEKMQFIFENTSKEDRYFNLRKTAIENLTAFRDGKYTLFPNVERLKVGKSRENGTSSNTSTHSPPFSDIFSAPNPAEQITLFESLSFPQLPTVNEQQAIIENKDSVLGQSWEEYVDVVKTDPDNVASYTEPFVLIENSESTRFKSNECLTFAEADRKFKEVEAEIWAERKEKPTGYKKTHGTIFYKDNQSEADGLPPPELSTYSFRYDIGDFPGEQSGLYNFLKMYRQNTEEVHNRGDGFTKAMNVSPESIANGKRMLQILEKSLIPEKSEDVETSKPGQAKVNMPVTKAVINSFSGADRVLYAKDEGSVYISNSFYIMKIAEAELTYLLEKLNNRRKKDFVEATETPVLLEHINKANGNFELTGTPNEMNNHQNDKLQTLVYADNKQYFCYDKRFVEMFITDESEGTKFFVNDNSSYDIKNHNLIVKDRDGGVLGLILPAKVPEQLHEQLADILPLEVPYKNEIERARENPTHDPYIEREFFNGEKNHFVSDIQSVDGKDKYLVPTIDYDENGENPSLSRHALLIEISDMENQIGRWENSRLYAEQEKLVSAERAQKEAAEKAIYENTNGYADNFPQLQKARALKVLNDYFHTKDYGNIRLKEFVETAIKNGGSLKIATPMKKKYREMEASDYFDEVRGVIGGAREDIEMRSNYNKAHHSYDRESTHAKWLKTKHPFLFYNIFRDESVLDGTFFNTEYRLYVDDNQFYEISKTAYDYGNYLVDGGILEKIRNELSNRGYAVSDELIANGIEEYGENKDSQDIASYIENNFLTDESEPDESQISIAESSKPPNFRITDDKLGHAGAKAKYADNIKAIKTLKALEAEKRFATPKEQEILSRYIGWGGIQEAFDETKSQWVNEYAELIELLSDEEYKSAKSSVLNAYYTSPTIIKAIYSAIERLGFKSGNVLEPSVGVGNFFGLLPNSMSSAKLYGVELDSISARIAKHLYPNSTIKKMGFEKTDYPDNFFDIAVGNVPFGDYGVVDKKYDKHKLKIHDYFFAKSLDQVRPGGIIAFVTSKGTLDKQNPDVRKYLAQRAELLGAVRLPMTAFKANAGTEVTTDIIFLQKRDRILDIEPDWVHLGQVYDAGNPENKISVNRYFADNPEMILGQMTTESGIRMYGNVKSALCIPIETMPDGSPTPSFEEQLQKAMLNIQGQITTPEVSVDIDDLGDSELEAIPADPNVKNFSFTIVDDKVYFRENSMMYPVDQPATTLERIKGMVQLRDSVRELITLQVDEKSMFGNSGEFDGGEHVERLIKAKQAELDSLYNNFNKEFGRINSSANNRAFATGQFSDNSYYLLCSLEVFDEDGNFKRKGDMFTKRTIKPKTVVTHVDTSTEALAVSMGEKAKVDIIYMAQLTGFTPEKIMQDLAGVIYCDITNPIRANEPFDPDKMKVYEKYPLVTADEFLSGNIRQKLEKARIFQETVQNEFHGIDVAFTVKALEDAMPKDLEAHEINLRLGSTWIAPEYVQQFMYETLQTSFYNRNIYQVKYHSQTGEWSVTGKGKALFNDIPSTVTYGTKRANAYQIIDDSLNLKDVRVYDYKTDENGNQIRELNKKETTLAQQKQEQLKQMFKDWIFKDPERREILVKLYNEKFNSTRPREYDGSHITFSGISPEIKLRPHQLNAIAHILYGGNTLLAHEVGAGKTFEIVAAGMESKRLGLTNKSLVAVPNHLTEQWGSEWLRLYPSANILVATKKDFEPRNRKKFIAKIATGEYDAIIIGHTQLEKIPLSIERQQRILWEQIDEITDGIREIKDSKGDNFTIKQMERTRKNLEVKLQKLMEGKKKDIVVTFEELGCDKLYVDESHFYKNLMLISKMRNVAGLSTSDAQKSTDLFMKTRYMDELTTNLHGRPCGTVFASGTPISNSIAELYTIQRYLQYDLLMDKDFSHFDSWASTFCEPQTTIELAPDNSGYRARTRLSTFHNLPELMAMFKDVADVQTADMLDLPVPKANYETIIAEPSDLQREMVEDLSERASRVQRKEVDARIDNMLKITTDGRKIGLDQRLMNDMLPDFEGSKINMCADNVLRIWEETKSHKLTQLIFCDCEAIRYCK